MNSLSEKMQTNSTAEQREQSPATGLLGLCKDAFEGYLRNTGETSFDFCVLAKGSDVVCWDSFAAVFQLGAKEAIAIAMRWLEACRPEVHVPPEAKAGIIGAKLPEGQRPAFEPSSFLAICNIVLDGATLPVQQAIAEGLFSKGAQKGANEAFYARGVRLADHYPPEVAAKCLLEFASPCRYCWTQGFD